jgi:tetratricopeptide (TPR) repeat protein
LQAAGRLGEALPLFEQTLADSERLLGASHPTVAVLLYRVGVLHLTAGNLYAARDRFAQAVFVDERGYGPTDREVAVDLEALADVQQRLGDLPAAQRSLRRALNIVRETDGADSPDAVRLTDRLRTLGE